MKVLYNPSHQTTAQDILIRLSNLALAHTSEVDESIDSLVLVEGLKSYQGVSEINQLVDQLEKEAGQWWYCDC